MNQKIPHPRRIIIANSKFLCDNRAVETSKKQKITKIIAYNAVIGALYAALTLAVYPLSYGPVQFRFAECLTILPVFFPSAYIGLTIGCAAANIFSLAGIADVLLGSLTTLVAGILTAKIKKMPWAFLPPIILNAFAVPAILLFFGGETVYWINVLTVGAGQAAVIFGLGIPLYYLIKKNPKVFNFLKTEETAEDSTGGTPL